MGVEILIAAGRWEQ